MPNDPPPPPQHYKYSHRGFSLAELTAAAVIMVGIWLGALAYMNAASEEFEEAKEETLDQASEEDIAILTEIRAAESALVAAERASPAAEQAFRAAAKGRATYMDVLQNVLGRMDTAIHNGVLPGAFLVDTRASIQKSGRNYYIVLQGNTKWPNLSEQTRLCQEAVRGKDGWSCQIMYAGRHTGIHLSESVLQ